jgi:hypothetical protein
MDEPTLQETLKSPCYFQEEDGLRDFLSSRINIEFLRGRIISRGGMKQKTVCKNVTRNIRTGRKTKPYKKVTRRICNDKYKHMYTFKVNGYFRDDEKACYENMHGTDIVSKPHNCGWYLNDKDKLSSDYRFVKKENNLVWRQH